VDRLRLNLLACGACLVVLAALALPAMGAAGPRIVSLAPHLTELLYAAGAGEYLVGASEYSDYPPAARDLPRVGDSFRLDYERIVALQPDFVVAWESGTPVASIARLEALGLRVVVLPVRTLGDIVAAVAELGALAGTGQMAATAAGQLEQDLADLRQRYASREPVRVFIQLDDEPLFTVTGRHLISEMVELCGGVNVFAGLPGLAPSVDLEAVIGADPEAILYTGTDQNPQRRWSKWQDLAAVRLGAVRRVSPDLVVRATPRAVAGVREICDAIELTRERRHEAGIDGHGPSGDDARSPLGEN
jgi:iron complex transport system substrate-binding protein